MLNKIITITLLAALLLSFFGTGFASASAASTMTPVIIVFKEPVASGDVKYLEAIGGVVKYTYTIINGVAVSLPQAAVDKLKKMQDNPVAPGNDPIAGRISYIENDGEMHVLTDEARSPATSAASITVTQAGDTRPGVSAI